MKVIAVLFDVYYVDIDSGNRVIQIGSEDYTVICPHTYTLTIRLSFQKIIIPIWILSIIQFLETIGIQPFLILVLIFSLSPASGDLKHGIFAGIVASGFYRCIVDK